MKEVTLYTDGSCSGNPGPGGWGAILIWKGLEKELSGGESQTTNNRMELTGAIRGLSALKEPCAVELYTDSQYIAKAVNEGWLEGWRKRGWKKADRSPIANPDLWQELDRLFHIHQVKLIWVKGHADNPFNNRCDALAVAQTKKFASLLEKGL